MKLEDVKTDEQFNKLAAEIMGWTFQEVALNCSYYHENDYNKVAQYAAEWNPVNDMSQCWLLVEKMESEGWEYTIQGGIAYNGLEKLFDFVIFKDSIMEGAKPYSATNHHKQKAIILACGLALGV